MTSETSLNIKYSKAPKKIRLEVLYILEKLLMSPFIQLA